MNQTASIRTIYKGITFRSKLEADWAITLDSLGVAWRYERAGKYFGRIFYLPDFFLPVSGQYLEVKGQMDAAAIVKAVALCTYEPPLRFQTEDTPDIPLVMAEPGGCFWGYRRPSITSTPEEIRGDDLTLFQCLVCSGWWFADACQGWKCRCCGAYDGDGHISRSLISPILPFPLFPAASDPGMDP